MPSPSRKIVSAHTNEAFRKELIAIFARGAGHGFSYAEQLRFALDQGLGAFGVRAARAVPERAEETTQEFLQLYAKAVETLPAFDDVLGPLYMDLASVGGKQILGQYFTPQTVADMMAQMGACATSPADASQLVTVCDPAAGSGVMLLSFLRHIEQAFGATALANISVTAVDLDAYCASVCALQLLTNISVRGLLLGELLVVHGNSLFPEELWDTVVHATHPNLNLQDVSPAAHATRKESVRHAASTPGQVELPF